MGYKNTIEKQLHTRDFSIKESTKDEDRNRIVVEITGPDGLEDTFVLEEVNNAIRKTQAELDEVQTRLTSFIALKEKMSGTIDKAKKGKNQKQQP